MKIFKNFLSLPVPICNAFHKVFKGDNDIIRKELSFKYAAILMIELQAISLTKRNDIFRWSPISFW